MSGTPFIPVPQNSSADPKSPVAYHLHHPHHKGPKEPTNLPFLKEDQFTDTILVLEGKKLYINRCILGYASPYFQKLLDSAHKAAIADKKSKAEVKISNKSYLDFVDLLTYLHPGTGSDVTGIYSNPNRTKESWGRFTPLNNLSIWYVDIGHIFKLDLLRSVLL